MPGKSLSVAWSRWRPQSSIGAKTLLAFLLVTAVLVGGFYLYTFQAFTAHVRKDAIKEVGLNMHGAMSLYQSRMERMRSVVFQTASAGPVRSAVAAGDSRALEGVLEEYSAVWPRVDLWAVIGLDRVVMTGSRGKATGVFEASGAIEKAMRTGQAVLSTEALSAEALAGLRAEGAAQGSGAASLVQLAVVPVASGGKVVGAFLAGRTLSGDSAFSESIHEYFNMDGAVLALAPSGTARVVASSAEPGSVFNRTGYLDEAVAGRLAKGGSFLGAAELEAGGVFLAIEPLLDHNGSVVGGLAVAATNAYFEVHLEAIKTKMMAVAAAGLLFSLLLAAIIYRDTQRPVRAIREAMEEAASGNLDTTLDIRTKDEFESIGKGFNRMVESIRTRQRKLDSFNQLTKVLIEFSDPKKLLDNALARMVELTGSQIGAIYIYDDEAEVLRPEACSGLGEAELGKLRRGEGLAGRCLAERRTIVLNDTTGSEVAIDAGAIRIRPAGLIWLCISSNGRSRGVLFLGSMSTYEEDEIRHMEHLMGQIDMALDNAMVHREVERLSVTDHLTGVFNRRRFAEVLDHEFKAAARYSYTVGVIMMDVDDFKLVNDSYGHLQGDSVLTEISALIKANTRNTDIWARYGGEEFVGLVTHCDQEGARILADKLKCAVERHEFAGMRGKKVTISIGVGFFPGEGVRDMEDLVRAADENLYKAKRSGKNQVVCSPAPQQEKVKLVRS